MKNKKVDVFGDTLYIAIVLHLVLDVTVAVTAMAAGVGVSSEMPTDELSDVASQLRTMRQLIARLVSLNVDPTEYACLKAIVLFKPGNLQFSCICPSLEVTPYNVI